MNAGWLVIRSGTCAPGFNMALDEALLNQMPRLNSPTLRYYAWTEPAASFGYFQKYEEIARATFLRPLIRRPTGGGLVPHDRDWTYSLVFPSTHGWFELKAIESYRAVHQWIADAFERMNVRVELAETSRRTLPGQCFSGYEQFDVLWRGQKIAGAAQRRTRHGLLIQGSIQPPPLSLDRRDWEQAMIATSPLDAKWEEWNPDVATKETADRLCALKYSRPEYHCRR